MRKGYPADLWLRRHNPTVHVDDVGDLIINGSDGSQMRVWATHDGTLGSEIIRVIKKK